MTSDDRPGYYWLHMVDDLLSGRVTSFRREQGFGIITLDDGRDVKFDAHNCNMLPEEGAPVRLKIAPARWGGGFKATVVEAHGATPLHPPTASLAARMATAEANARLGEDEQPVARRRAR